MCRESKKRFKDSGKASWNWKEKATPRVVSIISLHQFPRPQKLNVENKAINVLKLETSYVFVFSSFVFLSFRVSSDD